MTLKSHRQEYDSLGRPTISHLGISDYPIDSNAATSEVPPQGSIPGFSLASTSVRYNGKGQTHETIDAEQRLTEYKFENFGRLNKSVAPPVSGISDTFAVVFDPLGRPELTRTTVYDPEGRAEIRESELDYDMWGRVTSTTGDPGGLDLITDFAYDALGRATTEARRWLSSPGSLPALDPNDRVTTRQFDAAGRLTTTSVRSSETDWATTTVDYDGDGLMTFLEDAQSNRTDYDYGNDDGLGRLERMRYPADGGKRQTIEYVSYDKLGRPETVEYREDNDTSASKLTWQMEYDERGRLDRRWVPPPGGSFEFRGATEQLFGYDDLGRIVFATDRSAEAFPVEPDIDVGFVYNSLGRRIDENQPRLVGGAVQNHHVESNYGPDGFRTLLRFPESFDVSGLPIEEYVLTYEPDDAGRLEWISGPISPTDPANGDPRVTGTLVDFRYLGGQLWERSYTNDTERRAYLDGPDEQKQPLYDALGRTTGIREVDSDVPSQLVVNFRYGYDRVGNLTHEQRLHEEISSSNVFRTRAYRTDHMGRLTKWTEGSLGAGNPVPPQTVDPTALLTDLTDEESWTLDLVGNWTKKASGVGAPKDTLTSNGLNQATSLIPSGGGTAEELSYDWLGQMRDNEISGQKYVWDAFGRVTEVRDSANSLIARYRYDALNRRVEKELANPPLADDIITRYFYDGWRAIEERAMQLDTNSNDYEAVRARYGFGLSLDETLWMDRDVAPTSGSPDGIIESRLFVHHDLSGSSVALSDDTGTVVERFTYDAYGAVSAWTTPTWQGTGYTGYSPRSEHGFPYLYTGQRFDAESGLYYYKNRIYDPRVGQFLRRDPIGYADALRANIHETVPSPSLV